MRHKIPEEKKKEKMTLTIDEKVINLFDKYLSDNDITNKSKYIRKDMDSKGKDVNKEF